MDCIGQRVAVRAVGEGVLRYFGPCAKSNDENDVYLGIELDNPQGDCDGTMENDSYFRCAANHGLFVPLNANNVRMMGYASHTPMPQLQSLTKRAWGIANTNGNADNAGDVALDAPTALPSASSKPVVARTVTVKSSPSKIVHLPPISSPQTVSVPLPPIASPPIQTENVSTVASKLPSAVHVGNTEENAAAETDEDWRTSSDGNDGFANLRIPMADSDIVHLAQVDLQKVLADVQGHRQQHSSYQQQQQRHHARQISSDSDNDSDRDDRRNKSRRAKPSRKLHRHMTALHRVAGAGLNERLMDLLVDDPVRSSTCLSSPSLASCRYLNFTYHCMSECCF
jgi:hypothetical protein